MTGAELVELEHNRTVTGAKLGQNWSWIERNWNVTGAELVELELELNRTVTGAELGRNLRWIESKWNVTGAEPKRNRRQPMCILTPA
ncbi:hypothetical protein [Paenibacillus borealis]|uniref:Uncharacterized protein n=1 Tax=Paenibacillus borealis TaxID=160799 RepID=A0A089LG70_PAEBO|nr:hypothetical protein [Paenibacillus borealis]AIQ60496.1 hypothetical protein PBOR_28790 [Paenibacillus borealis]